MALMDDAPFDFILNHEQRDLNLMNHFVHRTFNSSDLIFFVSGLKHIYSDLGGLESVFKAPNSAPYLHQSIHNFRQCMFEVPHQKRSEKHISDPLNKSAAKRLHMFLRWMVRQDTAGVDFGIWNTISPAVLSCPLDVHSAGIARKLGILTRKQNDGKALGELDKALREMDPIDPVKYDFALFGLGAFEKF